MLERIVEKLENPLVCYIAMCVSVALAIMTGCCAIACGIFVIALTVWWAIGFVLCTILCGVFVGISMYLYAENWG